MSDTWAKSHRSDRKPLRVGDTVPATPRVRLDPALPREWHVVFVGPQAKQRADELLKADGYEVYCPMLRTIEIVPLRKLSAAQRKLRIKPSREIVTQLFPCYQFVRMNYHRDPWRELFARAVIRGMVYADGEPRPFPDDAIARIRAREIGGAIPGDMPAAQLAFQPGDEVRINDGPFRGFTGSVQQLDESGRIELLVALFGQATKVELDFDQVERAS